MSVLLTDSLYNALVQTYNGNATIPEAVSVTVQNSPMIYLVWGGVAIMLAGISVQFASELKTPANTQEKIGS